MIPLGASVSGFAFFFFAVRSMISGNKINCAVFKAMNDLLAVFFLYGEVDSFFARVPCSRSAPSVNVK